MKITASQNEAKRLNEQGHNITAGQPFEVENLKDWIRERADEYRKANR